MPSLKSTLLRELELAIDETKRDHPEHLEGAIHAIRRRCKRVRAYLLLPSKLHSQPRQIRERVRRAGLVLSPVRDSQVLLQTLRSIQTQMENQGIADHQLNTLRAIVLAETQRGAEQAQQSQALLAATRRLLKKARKKLKRLDDFPSSPDWVPQLGCSYADGRKVTRSILNRFDPELEAFHELRKMTKKFYHQCQFVSSARNIDLQQIIDSARSLADRLGEGLDLALTRAKLVELATAPNEMPSVAQAISRVEQQMQTCLTEATALACRAYFDTPRQLRQRIRRATSKAPGRRS